MTLRMLPVATIILLIALMAGGCSAPKKKLDQTTNSFLNVKVFVQEQSWNEAESEIKKLKSNWQSIKPRYQINQSSQTINQFENTLNRLEGYVTAKDKASSLAEIQQGRNIWKTLNSY